MKEYYADCTPFEEKINSLTHAPGVLIGALATLLLIIKFLTVGATSHLLSYLAYSFSFMLIFGASAIYHFAENGTKKLFLRKLDYACIYIFIAGCYTPFIVINMTVSWKYYFLAGVWIFALAGVIQKFKFKIKCGVVESIPYFAFGFFSLLTKSQLLDVLPDITFKFLVAGGVCYTTGAIFYIINKKFCHSIWHLFVLAGAILHFLAVYNTV